MTYSSSSYGSAAYGAFTGGVVTAVEPPPPEAATTSYTTPAKVASMLRLISPPLSRLTFDSTTDPTYTEVVEFILESEDDIDAYTNHGWRAKTVLNEYHDVGFLFSGMYRREVPVKLRHRNVRAMTSGTDKIEIWDGSSWIDLVLTANGYIEGRGNDYWVEYTTGIIYFVSTKPYYSEKGIRVTYRYGDGTIPKTIQEACTRLVAAKIIESDDYKAALPEGISPKDVQAKAEAWRKEAFRILERYREFIAV